MMFRHLIRRNIGKPYSKANCYWGILTDSLKLQPQTPLVKTPWGVMTQHDLSRYSIKNEGEDLPPEFHTVYWYGGYDDSGNPMRPEKHINTTLPALTLATIRKRVAGNIPIFSRVGNNRKSRDEW